MKYLQTFEQVTTPEYPADYADLYALYLLSQEKEDWFDFTYNGYEHVGDEFLMDFYKGPNEFEIEDQIVIKVPTDLGVKYKDQKADFTHPLKEFAFQDWVLNHPEIFNKNFNLEVLDEDSKHEGMIFEWHPKIKAKYPWLFAVKRTGII